MTIPDDDAVGPFRALLEETAEDLDDHAPCGYLSTLPDGRIIKVNETLLGWLGRRRDELVGTLQFVDLLSVGGPVPGRRPAGSPR